MDIYYCSSLVYLWSRSVWAWLGSAVSLGVVAGAALGGLYTRINIDFTIGDRYFKIHGRFLTLLRCHVARDCLINGSALAARVVAFPISPVSCRPQAIR